jgi:replicative DNA helicase
MLSEIRKKYSPKNVISSGIPELDANFLSGGFQPSRLYLMGGTSGVGKSILLLNCAIRASLSKSTEYPKEFLTYYDPDLVPPEQVFLYVTMENYVYETWLRLYCSLLQITKREVLDLMLSSTDSSVLSAELRERQRYHNSSVQIEYFPPNSITPSTIAGLIHKYSRDPKSRCVKAVYIDYLDLMKPDEKREFYRLDLAQITSGLKSIAAAHEIPIITATQLNREAYKKGKGLEIGSDMISESIQKLFIADFSAIMVRDLQDDKEKPEGEPIKLMLRVNKNRDGKTGDVSIYMDYPKSRFMTKEEFDAKYKQVIEI